MNKIFLFAFIILMMVSAMLYSQSGGQGGWKGSPSYVYIPHNSNIMISSSGAGTFTHTHTSPLYNRINSNIRKLSSAQRITIAGDDPAGLAVAEKMSGHIRALKREVMNARDYSNLLTYKESAIGDNVEIIHRLRELTIRAAGGILSISDRETLQNEVEQLLQQIDMNAEMASFNRKLVIPSLTTEELDLAGFTVVTNPHSKLGLLDEVQARLSRLRTGVGVESNVLALQIEGKSYYAFNLQQSESQIRDLDMAAEFCEYSTNMLLYETNNGMILRH